MIFFVFDWWLLIGVSHLQEVGAAQSGLTVSFHMWSPSHVHLTLYMYIYATEKYNVLVHIKDKSNKSINFHE